MCNADVWCVGRVRADVVYRHTRLPREGREGVMIMWRGTGKPGSHYINYTGLFQLFTGLLSLGTGWRGAHSTVLPAQLSLSRVPVTHTSPRHHTDTELNKSSNMFTLYTVKIWCGLAHLASVVAEVAFRSTATFLDLASPWSSCRFYKDTESGYSSWQFTGSHLISSIHAWDPSHLVKLLHFDFIIGSRAP